MDNNFNNYKDFLGLKSFEKRICIFVVTIIILFFILGTFLGMVLK